MQKLPRVLCHFSCGAASAVATWLALQKYGQDRVEIVCMEIKEEHADNKRFLADCEKWYGKKITVVRNEKYDASIYEVFRRERFILSPQGAPCTAQLKRKMRARIQRPDDIHVLGYTLEENDRALDFEDHNPGLAVDWLLVDSLISKNDCYGILEKAGIALPAMYLLGYQNNNCIGCVKGAMGYWNKIRVDFPQVFARMAMTEREIGYSVNKDKNGPVWLDELDPQRGNAVKEPNFECGFVCESVKTSND